MKKLLSVILSVAILLSIAIPVTISPASATLEKGSVVKVWVSDAKVKTVKEIAESFESKNSGVKIKISVQTEAEAGTQILADAESAADVAVVASDQMRNLKTAGCITALDSSESSTVKNENVAASVKAATVGSKLYGFPLAMNGYYLVYNKKYISDKKAKNFESILKACKKHGKKFIMDSGNGYYSAMFLFTGGLKLNGTSSDGVQKFKKYNVKKLAATAKAYSKLFHKYKKVFKSAPVFTIPTGFAKKTVAAGIDGNWDEAANKKILGKNYGAVKLPKIKVGKSKKQTRAFCGTLCVVKNSYSKCPKAAAAFAKYLSSEYGQSKLLNNTLMPPTNKKLQKTKAFYKTPGIKALLDQSKNAEVQADVGAVWDPFGNFGNKIMSKKINPKKFNYKKLVKKTIKSIKDQ